MKAVAPVHDIHYVVALGVSTYTNIIIKEYVNVGRASCSHITNTDYNAFSCLGLEYTD